MTINFGPQTVTFPHTDMMNLSYGWCSITALGKFQHNTGGQLALWNLKLLIPFPAGSTIFIPSAIIKHSNCLISNEEKRYSLTQFCSADLFRWAENGGQNDTDVMKSIKEEQNEEQKQKLLLQRQNDKKTRWETGICKYSTIEEIKTVKK